jgi:nascent polypeptide-associated complex subunit alpha
MERMGINLEPLEGVEEVRIVLKDRVLVVRDATVSEVRARGMRMFQVIGDVEEAPRELEEAPPPPFTEEDVLLVAQQAGVSREEAEQALRAEGGDLARAILRLKG